MNILKATIFSFLLFAFLSSYKATNTNDTTSIPPLNTGFFSVGLSGNLATFFGDLNTRQNLSSFNNFRPSVGLQVERRFGKLLGVSVNGNVGSLSQNDRNRNLNFETKFTQVGLALTAHFDWTSKSVLSPFVSAGANYMMFNVYSDLKDAQQKQYYYWTDGTIRIAPQKDSTGIINYSTLPLETQRDYTYESTVTETFDGQKIKNYPTTCWNIPLTIGLKFKLFEFFETRFSTTYNIITSDYVDNYSDKVNDSYLSTSLSVHYTIGKRYVDPKEVPYKPVDFKSIAKEDADMDGVNDMLDGCPHTPKNIQVDAKGCPLDDDGDGVANYLDKEPNTASGATVNRDGITLTEEELKKLYEMRESTYMEKITTFYEQPNEETLRKIAEELNKEIVVEKENPTSPNNTKVEEKVETPTEQKSEEKVSQNNTTNNTSEVKTSDNENIIENKSTETQKEEKSSKKDKSKKGSEKSSEQMKETSKVLVLPIPQNVRFADGDGDGKLQPKEITGAIDDYLDGNVDATVTDIMDMIDYFFSQQ